MISVLFVAKNSVYKSMTDSAGEPLDCWDEERDALNWPGGNPIVAHPPCGEWSQIRRLSHRRFHPKSAEQLAKEKALAPWAVEQVRKWGGVLEHPFGSDLWRELDLPEPGRRDDFGICLSMPQWWFGHKAQKNTLLYVCGTCSFPNIPLKIGEPEYIVSTLGSTRGGVKRERKKSLWSNERKATPPAFARWLVQTAELCKQNGAKCLECGTVIYFLRELQLL